MVRTQFDQSLGSIGFRETGGMVGAFRDDGSAEDCAEERTDDVS